MDHGSEVSGSGKETTGSLQKGKQQPAAAVHLAAWRGQQGCSCSRPAAHNPAWSGCRWPQSLVATAATALAGQDETEGSTQLSTIPEATGRRAPRAPGAPGHTDRAGTLHGQGGSGTHGQSWAPGSHLLPDLTGVSGLGLALRQLLSLGREGAAPAISGARQGPSQGAAADGCFPAALPLRPGSAEPGAASTMGTLLPGHTLSSSLPPRHGAIPRELPQEPPVLGRIRAVMQSGVKKKPFPAARAVLLNVLQNVLMQLPVPGGI